MRVILLFVALAGCGFTGAAGGGDRPIDATSIDGRLVDAPAHDIDAPMQPPDAPLDAPPMANSCGSGYGMVAGAGTSTYRKVNTPRTWETARLDCADDGNGAHLVIPQSKAEGMTLHAFVAPDSDSPYFWAGIREDDPNDWETVLGDDYQNPPWAPNEPDDDPCVLIGSSGAFYDYSCTASQEYACECPPTAPGEN